MSAATQTNPATHLDLSDQALLALLLTRHAPSWLTIDDLLRIDINPALRMRFDALPSAIADVLRDRLTQDPQVKIPGLPHCLLSHSHCVQIVLSGHTATLDSITAETLLAFICAHISRLTTDPQYALLAAFEQKIAAKPIAQLVQLWRNQDNIAFAATRTILKLLRTKLKLTEASEADVRSLQYIGNSDICNNSARRLTELWQQKSNEELEGLLLDKCLAAQEAAARLLIDKHALSIDDLIGYVRQTKPCGEIARAQFLNGLAAMLENQPAEIPASLLDDDSSELSRIAASAIVQIVNKGGRVTEDVLFKALRRSAYAANRLEHKGELLLEAYMKEQSTSGLVAMMLSNNDRFKRASAKELGQPHRIEELEKLAQPNVPPEQPPEQAGSPAPA